MGSDWTSWATNISDRPTQAAALNVLTLVDPSSVIAACASRVPAKVEGTAAVDVMLVTGAGVVIGSYAFNSLDKHSSVVHLVPWADIRDVEVLGDSADVDARPRSARIYRSDESSWTLPLQDGASELTSDELNVVRAVLSHG